MFLTAILDFGEKMMFARLDFPRFLVCCSGDLSDNESDEKPSVAICGGSICILTGLYRGLVDSHMFQDWQNPNPDLSMCPTVLS